MKRLKLKPSIKKKLNILVICVLIIFIGIFTTKTIATMIKQKHNIDYRLSNIGYKNIDLLKKYLNNTELEHLLSKKYDTNLEKLLSEKYFIKSNLDKYQLLINSNPNLTIEDVIKEVNVRSNENWYDKIIPTDLSKGNLILVNKFNNLDSTYVPQNLVEMSNWYSYGDNMVTEETYKAFIELFKAAEKEGYKIAASGSYRPYENQLNTYNNALNNNGLQYADDNIARAGHSEHQTGLAIDVMSIDGQTTSFEESSVYPWIIENAYLYGFIQRYPKNKTYITGYNFEPYHFRYVGKDVAKVIHDENITFDEYYAFYINQK